MEIRYLKETDDRRAISRIYEESWKYAYKDIIPREYLDSIPKGQWVQGLDGGGRHTLVAAEGRELIGTSSFCRGRMAEMSDFGEVISIYTDGHKNLPGNPTHGRKFIRTLRQISSPVSINSSRLIIVPYRNVYPSEASHAGIFVKGAGWKCFRK